MLNSAVGTGPIENNPHTVCLSVCQYLNTSLSLFTDFAVVEMTDAFRQPSLFYHLGVRESFSMANNIILYCDLNSDSLHSLQVRKSFVSVSPESRIKLVKFKLKGSFFQHLTFHKLPVWSLETKNIRGQKYCHNIFSHIIQYQNLSLNSFTKNCWYWSKNVHYVDMCSMRKKR